MSELVLGVVLEVRPQRLFRVRLVSGDEILAGRSAAASRLATHVEPGMTVRVQRSATDPSRGTILAPTESVQHAGR